MIRAARPGFTLVEFLVVTAIVGLVAVLALAALARGREAARRTQCVSHLYGVGVALHHHQEARGTFPAGAGPRSFLWKLLPFLGQEELSKAGIDDRTAAVPIPGSFLCPSDTARSAPLSRFATNYAGNAGVFGVEPVSSWDGVFTQEELGLREIADGMSFTAGVVEWVVGDGDATRGSRLGSIHTLDGDFPDTPPGREAFARDCVDRIPYRPGPAAVPFKGSYWFRGRLGHSLYTHALPPDLPSCRAAPDLNAITAGSLHSGGCNVLFMDGAVRFVSDTISPRVWRALGTRAGDEAVAQNAY